MSYKIWIQSTGSNPRNLAELSTIGGDITNPTFTGISNGNARLADAESLLQKCADYINKKVNLSVSANVLFVYRGVAVGGLQRNLGGFSAKPLTVKNKSIDPTLLQGNGDFERLTGLVPVQVKLGKNGIPGDKSTISLSANQAAYMITKIEDVGAAKSYLCCNDTDRTLSWEGSTTPSGKTLCTFLGDTTNPYLADWDLVTVGVTKSSIKQDSTVSFFKVIDKPTATVPHNILPQWLDDCLLQQVVPLNSHVTQHGPESLYCGNKIDLPNEEFLVLSGNAKSTSQTIINSTSSETGGTPFAKLQSYLSKNSGGFLFYQFQGFDGLGVNKPSDYTAAIGTFNSSNFK